MSLTEDELARLAELEDLLTVGLVEQPINGSVLSWGEAALIAHRIGRHLLRAAPVADTAGIDAAWLAEALRSMWPHHTEGIGSSPPSPTDHSYEVWEPFLPGSPDSVADILAVALRTPKPEGERE